jgi:hypothetical protein
MKEIFVIFMIFCFLFLAGCGGDESITDPSLDPNQFVTAPTVIPVPTRTPLTEEEIIQVIQIQNQVLSTVEQAISFGNTSVMEHLAEELRNTYGVEDVVLTGDTLSVIFEKGGISCWTDEEILPSELVPELPDIEKPPDELREKGDHLSAESSIKENKVIMINAFSDVSSRSNDVTCLNSMEQWFKNSMKYNVTRLNGSSINIESFKSLNLYGVIIYNGDGNFINFKRKDGTKEYITLLKTRQNVTSINNEGYWDDWYNYRLATVNSSYYVTNRFFDYYYYTKPFPSSIFYNGAPRGTKSADNQYPLCNSLYNRGAGAAIGWSEPQSIAMSSAAVLFYSMIFNPSTITLGDAIKALDPKYTQQKIKNVTSYLGYYPSGAADISLYMDTGHTFDSADSVVLPYKNVNIFNSSSEGNYYKIEVVSPSIVSAKITFNNSKGNLDLYLYDENKNEAGISAGNGNEESITATLQPGIFYICVKGSKSNSYVINIDLTVMGHSFATATDISLPYGASHMTESSKDNYYKLNLTEALSLRIQINSEQSGLYLYLYDGSQNQLRSGDGTENEKVITAKDLSPGLYYICVRGNPSKYNITAARSSEVGHTFESATEINPPYSEEHSIEGYEIDNFYRVNLKAPSSIDASIEFLHSKGDLDMYLFDGQKKLIEKSETIHDTETVEAKGQKTDKNMESSVLSAGTYYIKVHGYFGSLNSYRITVKVPDMPVLSGLTDEDGDNKDGNNSYSVVRFTLSGNNFRKNINSAKGKVTFVRVDDNSEGVADISSWSDGEIKGSVLLPGGKYWVHVTVKGYVTENEVFYFKGMGDVGF